MLGLAAGALGCKRDEVDVRGQQSGHGADFGGRALGEASALAAAAPSSAAAYKRFADRVHELRPRFDSNMAAQAKLRLLFLALPPLEAHEAKTPSARIAALATTVWPTLLGVRPKPKESARDYLLRICQRELAPTCKNVVPEEWDTVLRALVWRRLHERARVAHAACASCVGDHGYEAGLALMRRRHRDSGAAAELRKSRIKPNAWPAAVMHARWFAGGPVFTVPSRGPVELDGVPMPGRKWGEVMREARVRGPVLAVHLRPGNRVGRLRAIMNDARRAGFTELALLARHTNYPYELCAYHLALDPRRGTKVRARDVDTIQVLVHRLDSASETTPKPVLRI